MSKPDPKADALAYDSRETADIPLDFPVSVDGEKTSSLTMRRPKGLDRVWADKQGGTETEKVFKMMARLCGVAPELIAELDDVDLAKVDKQYGAFRGDKVS